MRFHVRLIRPLGIQTVADPSPKEVVHQYLERATRLIPDVYRAS
jgi:hypothetical protein